MTQVIESVTLGYNAFYDMLHYRSNGAKLKSVVGGMKWQTIFRQRPVKKHRFHIRPKVKFMNQYAFQGIYIGAPPVADQLQVPVAADTTAISHLYVNMNVRFNEWNQDFNMTRV